VGQGFEAAISQYMSLEQQIATLRRLRYYARYSLYRVLYLVGRGLIPAQSIGSYISDVAGKMMETPQARDLFSWIAGLVYTYSLKELAVRYAIHALGRHAAAPQDVLAFLVNTAKIDPDYAKALVNAYAIQYYPTVPQLATLAAYTCRLRSSTSARFCSSTVSRRRWLWSGASTSTRVRTTHT